MRIRLNISSLPNEIVFCRHAESEGNAVGISDKSTVSIPNHQFDLSQKGHDQTALTRDFVKERYPNGFDQYYISTFLRTWLTFYRIFDNNVPSEDPRLDEWWRGIFHNLSEREINEFYPLEKTILKREGWYHYRPPQGEAGKDVELRILSFLGSLEVCDRIFICGHGRWFLFFQRILCGRDRISNNYKHNIVPGNCSVISFKKYGDIFQSSVIFEGD